MNLVQFSTKKNGLGSKISQMDKPMYSGFFSALDKFKEAREAHGQNRISNEEMREAARVLVCNKGGAELLADIQLASNEQAGFVQKIVRRLALGLGILGAGLVFLSKEKMDEIAGLISMILAATMLLGEALLKKMSKRTQKIYDEVKELVEDANKILSD